MVCVFFSQSTLGRVKNNYKNPRFDSCTSFANMPSSKTLNRVCLLIDFEGFYLNNVFKCREMGWRSWNNHRGNIKYKMLHYFEALREKDKVTAKCVTKHIHGLTFNVGDHEHPKPQECLYQDVYELYNTFKTLQQDLVGYKGGHFEKDVLNELNIPCINLEEWGCPKFDKLMKRGFPRVVNCGHHIHNWTHCATVECEAFWTWLMSQSTSYSNPSTNILHVRTWMDNI